MKYYEKVNERLNKDTSWGRKKLKEAESIRERHHQDIKKVHFWFICRKDNWII